jgi:hypothetical protein
MNSYKELIPGGLASGRSPQEFDTAALAKGIAVELEHTTNPMIAREIAMDHLVEDPSYYEKLAIIEDPKFPVVRRVHLAGEWLGLLVAGPVAIYASTKVKAPWLRFALLATGIGTMAVDAWLLKRARG